MERKFKFRCKYCGKASCCCVDTIKGDPGERGPTGATGAIGATGATGPIGLSDFAITTNNGYAAEGNAGERYALPIANVVASNGIDVDQANNTITVDQGGCYYAEFQTNITGPPSGEPILQLVDSSNTKLADLLTTYNTGINDSGPQFVKLSSGDAIALKYLFASPGQVVGSSSKFTLIKSDDSQCKP